MTLFQKGKFTLASGESSGFKIECDALSETDWDALAYMISDIVRPFDLVLGVPRGGLHLQVALTKYRRHNKGPELPLSVLIVDDVWTTGGSMRSFKDSYSKLLPGAKFEGAVAFARSQPELWVQPLFQLHPEVYNEEDGPMTSAQISALNDITKKFDSEALDEKTPGLLGRIKTSLFN